MKTPPASAALAATFLGFFATPAAAQDQLPPSPQISLEAADITGHQTAPQKLVITFTPADFIDRGSLGDDDIWVAVPGGFNRFARLESLENIGGIPNGSGFAPVFALRATYLLDAPARSGWNEDANGHYSVLTAVDGISLVGGTGIGTRLLGEFGVRIGGEHEPVLPVEASVEFLRFQAPGLPGEPPAEHVVAVSTLQFYTTRLEVDWGTLTRRGNRFSAEVDATGVPYPPFADAAPTEVVHRYELDTLGPGEYSFVLSAHDTVVARNGFTIEDPGPPNRPELVDIFAGPAPGGDGLIGRLAVSVPCLTAVSNWGDVHREGTQFSVDLAFEDIDPSLIFAPLPDRCPEQLFEHTYALGTPGPGEYVFLVKFDGEPVGRRTFIVERGGGDDPCVIPADVQIEAASHPVLWPSPELPWQARVTLGFADAGHTEVVDWGDVRRDGNRLFATFKAVRRETPRPPEPFGADGGPGDLFPRFFHPYDLGILEPGNYVFVLRAQTSDGPVVVGETAFNSGSGVTPMPEVVDVEVLPTDDGRQVGVVALALPCGFALSDWGAVRQEGTMFEADIQASPTGTDGEPSTDPALFCPDQLLGHRYDLGSPEPGRYSFVVRINGLPVARDAFQVSGDPGDTRPPAVQFSAEPVTLEGREPQLLTVTVTDRSGVDLVALRESPVTVVGPGGDEREAVLADFTHTEDEPPRTATATYAFAPPEGSWNREDNGRYQVYTDPGSVRDLDGNPIRERHLGAFQVEIWPVPPLAGRLATFDASPDADGTRWSLRGMLWVPTSFASLDHWEIDPGPLHPRGDALVAQPRFLYAGTGVPVLASELDWPRSRPGANSPEWTAVRVSYHLRTPEPGHYRAVLISNVGHFVTTRFLVPGGGGDSRNEVRPYWRWRTLAGITASAGNSDGGFLSDVFEYALGLDPNDPSDDLEAFPKPVLIGGSNGQRHLALRYRRALAAHDIEFLLQRSSDCLHWEDVPEAQLVTERTGTADGLEEVTACLREPLGENAAEANTFLRLAVGVR